MTRNISAARNQALTVAGRLLPKRRQARWLGLKCGWITLAGCAWSVGPPGFWPLTINPSPPFRGSLILHARVEQGVSEVHDEVQDHEESRVENDQSDDQRVITIERTVDDEHSQAGDLKNCF